MTIYSQDEFIAVYHELYNKQDAIYSKHSILEYNMLIENKNIKVGYGRSELLKKHVLNERCKSVLEIGSGIGLVGSYIRNQNKMIKYLGIEIDQESFNKSQSLKLNTLNGDFTLMKNLEESFDNIMLWEVIEHLQDLKQFLDLAYAKLNSGGSLILSTPNYDKIKNYPNRVKDCLYQNEPPIHLNFFTKSNLANVMSDSGFKNCKIRVKKFPYLEKNKIRVLRNYIKAIFGHYYGSTLYLEVKKK